MAVIRLGEEARWATTHRARGVSWTLARGRFSKQTFLIDLLWVSWHLSFRPWSRRTHTRMSVACSVHLPAPHASLSACVHTDTSDVVPQLLLCSSWSSVPWCQKYWYRMLPKSNRKSIADAHFNTTDEKYRSYLHQYSRRIDDSICSDTNTASLTTLHSGYACCTLDHISQY